MNKIKTLCLLSLGAVTASCALSCNFGKKKNNPVEVYFYANAYELSLEENEDGELVKTLEQAYYSDYECAEVTAKNVGAKDGDKLEYGKDLEITITPKTFFSMKEWDLGDDSWNPIGQATHPFVGLGSPSTPYSYELAEDVAWTFKDETPYDAEKSSFGKEKYTITVKGDFFQRNLVIAFTDTDHPIYVHNSPDLDIKNIHFCDWESKGKTGDDAKPMDPILKPKGSSTSAAGSSGPTYTLQSVLSSSSDNKYISFANYQYNRSSDETPREDKKTYEWYNNISVYGHNSASEDDNKEDEMVCLSTFEKGSREKHFGLQSTKDSLSFTIPWGLLVKDVTYDLKYEEIYIYVDTNAARYDKFKVENVNLNGNDTTLLSNGLYQKYETVAKDGTTKIPTAAKFDDANIYIKLDESKGYEHFGGGNIDEKNSTFTNSYDSIQYGVVFKTPRDNKLDIKIVTQSEADTSKAEYQLKNTDKENYTTHRKAQYMGKYSEEIAVKAELKYYNVKSTDSTVDLDPWKCILLNPVGTPAVGEGGIPEAYAKGDYGYDIYYLNGELVNKFGGLVSSLSINITASAS